MIKKDFIKAFNCDELEHLMMDAIDYIYAPTLDEFRNYYVNKDDDNIEKDFKHCELAYEKITKNKLIKMTADDIIDTFNSVPSWGY